MYLATLVELSPHLRREKIKVVRSNPAREKGSGFKKSIL
jgi:hypothetical protein